MTLLLVVFLTLVSVTQTVLLLTVVSMLKNSDDSVTLVAERVAAYALRTHLHTMVDQIARRDDAAAAVKDASEAIGKSRDRWSA